MNGPHDMGGMQCYGPVIPEEDEPLFHGDWEKKAMAITVGMGFTGMWNLDMGRFHRESLPPAQYLSSSYYEIWLSALQNLMVEKGLVTLSELETGKIEFEGLATKKPVPNAKQVLIALSKGAPVMREVTRSAKFQLGDKVLTSTAQPKGHTRLPRYARGKIGEIIAINGAHVFSDSNAAGEGEYPQYLYTMAFVASDLFGEGEHEVMLDLFEPYLENADGS